MNITPNTTLGAIVAEDYRTVPVLEALQIDFCCNGNRTIEKVCQEQNLNSDDLINQLQEIINQPQNENSLDFQKMTLNELIDYIVENHHKKVENTLPEIKKYLHKISSVHGDKHPELHTINQLFLESADDLITHMKKEEIILFPFIKKLELEGNIPLPFGKFENPIAMMHHDHSIEGERFAKIAQLSNNYTVPEDGCGSYQITYAMLKDFEEDLHHHIHLENNILFPKTLELAHSEKGAV